MPSPAPRQVVVDYADNSVEPTFRLEPKALVRLGEVRLSGKTRISQRFIRRLAPWSRGDVYAPAKLAKLERRLIDAGVFEGVSVSLAPEESGGRPRPVLVSLNDRKPRSVEIGAGYSTAQAVDGGCRVRRRLFHRRGLRRGRRVPPLQPASPRRHPELHRDPVRYPAEARRGARPAGFPEGRPDPEGRRRLRTRPHARL